jgi:hypothetical protein
MAESESELDREKKWLRITEDWIPYTQTHQPKLEARVLKGIPDSMRSRVWRLFLDPADDISGRAPVRELAEQPRTRFCEVIDLDLHRTFPTMVIFSNPLVLDSLRNVLCAYSHLDPEIGYVQGMGFIAGMLCAYLDETRSFWCFHNLMNGPVFQLKYLYMHEFQGLKSLAQVWEVILAEKYQRVSDHLKTVEIGGMVYLPAWFLSGFMRMNWRGEVRLAVFDRLVAFGCRALLSFALTIVSRLKRELAALPAGDCLQLLHRPEERAEFEDWRPVIAKYSKLWISAKDYARYFRRAGVEIFM